MKKIILIIIIISAFIFIITGCSSEINDKIGIRGYVTEIAVSSSGANILVEGKIEEDTEFDKASVSINSDTVIKKDGIKGKLKISDIEKGDKVEVVFTGAVAESYPVQGTAKSIRIIK
ncbi:MAG: YobA family protein [Bacillota bacterium]|nr:YobA family protein [Bacillota bacterium]